MIAKRDLTVLFLCLTLISCKEEIVPDRYKPSNKHKAYIVSLEELNLNNTALGRDWIESSKEAISKPVRVETPYEEAFYLDPSEAEAVGYRFPVKRGQKVMIDIFSASADSVILFVDLFRVVSDSLQRWIHVATADQQENKLAFEPRQDGEYIVRLQPELLRGGKYSIAIRRVPSLLFPVAGKDSRAIGSFFGAPRDGGRRDHHGVDIFAKRYTPIIAPTRGYIRSVREASLGGKVIWLNDRERGQSLYFAHLQEQLVEEGTWVEPGDTIGTVGNTGNARTTLTHLHFGIYNRGPWNPLYHIKELNQETDSIMVDQNVIGSFARISATTLYTPRISPAAKLKSSSDTIQVNQIFKIIGAYKNFYKVRLTNSAIAYLPGNLVESDLSPLQNEVVIGKAFQLLTEPDEDALSKQIISEGQQISVLGLSADYWWVRTSTGELGWIPAAALLQ